MCMTDQKETLDCIQTEPDVSDSDTFGKMIKECWDEYHDAKSAWRYTGD